MQMLTPYRQFSDSRGRMLGVVNDGQWEEINYIETAASCTRGGHFHRDTRELFLVLSGSIRVRVRPEWSSEVRETIVEAGSIFIVEPGEVHSFETLTECAWINALSKRFDQSAPDIVPAAA